MGEPEIRIRNRVIKEQLDAMGATGHYMPKRVEMPSPFTTIYGGFEHVVMQRKLIDVSSGLIDKREALEMLNALTAQIDEKKGDFDTLAGSYTALSASVSKNPDLDKLNRKREMMKMSGVHEIWNSMSRLREEIWQLERTQAGFLDGKRIIDEKEWMILYDELHAELLVNRNKLLSC